MPWNQNKSFNHTISFYKNSIDIFEITTLPLTSKKYSFCQYLLFFYCSNLMFNQMSNCLYHGQFNPQTNWQRGMNSHATSPGDDEWASKKNKNLQPKIKSCNHIIEFFTTSMTLFIMVAHASSKQSSLLQLLFFHCSNLHVDERIIYLNHG